jgi:hypothetical protein
MVSFAKRIKQGFNLRVWMSNQMTLGIQAWDAGSSEDLPDGIGLEYPAGTRVEHLYGAGPRIGAIIDGVIRVTEGYNGYDARKEFLPEYTRILKEHFWRTIAGSNAYDVLGYSGYYYNHSIIVNRKDIDDDNDGRVDEDELDGNDNDGDWNITSDDVGADGLPDSIEVSCDGIPYDSVANPDPAGDDYNPGVKDKCHPNPDGTLPYKNDGDIWTEKNGISDHGEPNVDEDYGAVSNNDLYCSATDTFSRPIIAQHVPMGAKVFQKSYAWQTGTSADAIVFLDYKFINLNLSKTWQDAYIGFFADMDIGPINNYNYIQNNYAAYDSITRTAYIHNPVDAGSTPLGLTLLGTSRPLDSLKTIFQWSDFSTRPDPGTYDSGIYSWMSGDAFPGQLISPNQSPDTLSDTRFIISNGPFQVNPNDTVKVIYALVSGYTVDDMLNNARRAHRIYTAGGFIMPVASIKDSGGGQPVTLEWAPIDRSPSGLVTSYRVYYGTSSGTYTDSVTTADLHFTFFGLSGSANHYFAVAAIDDKGNRGALSDELTNAPAAPYNFRVYGQQTTINLQWGTSHDPDIAGFNIYRKTSTETTFVRLNSSLIADTSFYDADVWGDKTYSYKISSVDQDGHESGFSQVLTRHLIPPLTPTNFLIGPGKNYIYLDWSPNTEEDFAGYNIYCNRSGDSVYRKLNDTLYTRTSFIDSVQGNYYIEAIDITDAVSTPTRILNGFFATMDKGILVCDNSFSSHTPGFYDSTRVFYEKLLQGYQYKINPYGIPAYNIYDPSQVNKIELYSSILWFYENQTTRNLNPQIFSMPLALKAYVLGGGKLLLMGRKLTTAWYPYWYQFIADIFGVNSLLEINTEPNFSGASGMQGFPSVGVDNQKLAFENETLGMIERFPNTPTNQIIYTYNSSPLDTSMEGDAIGLRAVDSTIKAYYMSFPLYYLDSANARSFLTYVLNDFGEYPLGVRTIDEGIPREFRLYDAYPNPFNPSTNIRFDLPVESDVKLVIYDIMGKEVDRLIEERKQAGRYELSWNASNVASGVYFYRIYAQGIMQSYSTTVTKKTLLMK